MSDDPNTPPVASEAPATPVAEPVQQWQPEPPVGTQVQYVVQHNSVEGLGGWLMFWLVIFAIAGISYATSFFTQLGGGVGDASGILYLMMAPLMAIAYLTAVVFIAMRKKLGKILAISAIGVTALYAVISAIIDIAGNTGGNIGSSVGGLVAVLIVSGLMALYFIVSRRVKATLINQVTEYFRFRVATK